MGHPRVRAAVSPLRRRFLADDAGLPSVHHIVTAKRPEEPVHCIRPAAISAAARTFLGGFPGNVLYAVKCNPDPRVLRPLWDAGVRHFDCASPAEIALIRQMFPAAVIHYMHPVKARAAIREAWNVHGVADFVIDSADELAKVVMETGGGTGRESRRRGVIVRLRVGNTASLHDLSGKFGASAKEAVALLRAARPVAATLGVSFHVGSQCLDPRAYRDALRLAGHVIDRAGVAVEVIDVGGGFPAAYANQSPPPLGAYFAEIEAEWERQGWDRQVRLWAEPGRALVAGGVSLIVQVQLRRGGDLYINDGIYGSLSDAARPGILFPARRLGRTESLQPPALRPFRLFGPTCDSLDVMPGPFLLPHDTQEGDWLEIGQLGAYGGALRTAFNGFDRAHIVEVSDPPLTIDVSSEIPLVTHADRRSVL